MRRRGAAEPAVDAPPAGRRPGDDAEWVSPVRRSRLWRATSDPSQSRFSATVEAGRFWEIDLARTVAIGMMVAYHTGWNLQFLAPQLGIDPFGGGWRVLQVATGSLFLLLVGASLWISDARARARGRSGLHRWKAHACRAAQVLVCAMLVSVATWSVLADRYVRFGILHLIGLAILLAAPLASRPRCAGVVGAAVIAVGLVLRGTTSDLPGVLIFGLSPPSGAGVDYYPLLPWLGVVLLGIWLGGALYPAGERGRWSVRLRKAPTPFLRALTIPGRRSLGIYLVHQPVLIALLAGALALGGIELMP